MTEDQKNELKDLNRSTIGELFDRRNYISINLISNQVIIKDINGFSDGYYLNGSDLSRAIHINQGNTKKYLIMIKQVIK